MEVIAKLTGGPLDGGVISVDKPSDLEEAFVFSPGEEISSAVGEVQGVLFFAKTPLPKSRASYFTGRPLTFSKSKRKLFINYYWRPE